MSNPDGYTSLDLTPDRWDDVVDVVEWAFLEPWLPEERVAVKSAFVWDRARGMSVEDPRLGTPGTMVAVRCSYPFTMLVPGGERVPTSGLSWVAVHPGHRRRGLLSSMIEEHFAHALERGEYISALGASEPVIYQRFGYGLAAWQAKAKFGRSAELRDVPGASELTVRLERLNAQEHPGIIAELQRQCTRPGTIVREGKEILADLFASDVDERPKEERIRIAIVSDADDTPVAYALFRRKGAWTSGTPKGEVNVFASLATSAASARRLWGVLFDLDLTSSITVEMLAIDDRLLWLARDQRAPKAVVDDALWIRILDAPRALEARSYEAPIDMVIEVTDAQLPANAGLWRITTEPVSDDDFDDEGDAPSGLEGGIHIAHVAKATATDGHVSTTPDLSIGIQELSAAYLGGVSLLTLWQTGLIEEHTPGASALLSAAMHSPEAPATTFHF